MIPVLLTQLAELPKDGRTPVPGMQDSRHSLPAQTARSSLSPLVWGRASVPTLKSVPERVYSGLFHLACPGLNAITPR